MGSVKKKSGAVLSTAAAALLACAPLTASAQDQEPDGNTKGQCWGLNACKGLSHCKGAVNACKGQNSCKGEGFLILSMDSCLESGGDFAEGDFVEVPK